MIGVRSRTVRRSGIDLRTFPLSLRIDLKPALRKGRGPFLFFGRFCFGKLGCLAGPGLGIGLNKAALARVFSAIGWCWEDASCVHGHAGIRGPNAAGDCEQRI